MFAGCFSWCPLLRRWSAKKQSPEIEVSIHPCCAISLTQSYHQGHQQAIVGVAAPVPVAKTVMEPESDKVTGLILVLSTLTNICTQNLTGNPRAVVPTTTQYFMATGKQALALLQTAAGVIPVPLLQDAIGIAMKIIEVCEVRRIRHGKSSRRFTYASLRRHQLFKNRSKSYKRGSPIS